MSNSPPTINPSTSGLTTRIALLAMLSSRPMHGYEVRQMLEKRQMHLWANIQYGSIYRGLQQLSREGLLEETGEERAGKRPTRTIYHITDAGREALRNLLRQAWQEPEMSAKAVDFALSMQLQLPKEEVLELIRARLQTLAELSSALTQTRSEVEQHLSQRPAAIRNTAEDLFFHRQLLIETEQRWTAYIKERLEAGQYDLTDEERTCLEQFHRGEHLPKVVNSETTST
jgi:DNA-binding PadR family transcriptional regulator